METKIYVYMVYALVTLYALCYQLQAPVEPFLVDKLTKGDNAAESAAAYGRLKSFFAFVQCIGSLVFGALLDRVGIRIGFVVNFLACALSYYLLSITDSMEMLFLSKVPGICVAGFLCAQTTLAKLQMTKETKQQALGRLTSAYTIGGVLGPYIGGQLGAQGDYFIGAQYATIGCLMAAVLCLFLPGDLDAPSQKEGGEENKKTMESKEPKGASKEEKGQLQWPKAAQLIMSLVWLYLFTKVVTGVANSMSRSALPLILKNELGFDEAMMGTMMSVQFGFGGFANAVLLEPLTKLLGGKVGVVVRNCVLAMAVGYLLIAIIFGFAGDDGAKDVRTFLFVGITMGLAMFQYSLSTSITVHTTDIVPQKLKGTLMGIEHALFSLASFVGPSAGIALFAAGGISGIGLGCAAVFLASLAVWMVFHTATDDGEKKQKPE